MHMPGAGADGAIVPPAAALAWQRLAPERWPLPAEAFPAGTALVGGAVRDALLNRLPARPDLDLVMPGDALALCRQLQRRHGGSAVVLDAERSIARLVLKGWCFDLAREEGGSLEADLHRRDYTVNAMALPLAQRHQLVDPLAGAADLAAGLLVAVAEANLLDDPLRLLRGLRLASELGFTVEARTMGWIRSHRHHLAQVAGERVLAELDKLALAPQGHEGLAAVAALGLLDPWCHRQEQGATAAQETLLALHPDRVAALGLSAEEAAQALPLARLATVVDERALQELRSSRRLQQRVEQLRHWQGRLGPDAAAAAERLPEAERLRLHRQLEQDLPALLLGWPTATARPWLQRWRNTDDRLFHPRAAIDGGSLQRELQLQPSPRLGDLLNHLMLEQAFARLQGRDDALQAARRWLLANPIDGRKSPRCD
jgi:tRNA nucleotidyltransferase (CCA-adding enzyme)